MVLKNSRTPFFIRKLHDVLMSEEEDLYDIFGFVRASSCGTECVRDLGLIMAGKSSIFEPDKIGIQLRKVFRLGTWHQAWWEEEFIRAGKIKLPDNDTKFKLARGERLRGKEDDLRATGTPDFYIVTAKESFLIEWKTISPNNVKTRTLPYDDHKVQHGIYDYLTLNGEIGWEWDSEKQKWYKYSPDPLFEEAFKKYKGRGWIIYDPKVMSDFRPYFRVNGSKFMIPVLDRLRKATKLYNKGKVAKEDPICIEYWKAVCPFSGKFCWMKKKKLK